MKLVLVTWKEKAFKDEYRKEFKTEKQAETFINRLKRLHYDYEVTVEEEKKKSKEIVKDLMAEYWKNHPK
jgi:hypothetical protein